MKLSIFPDVKPLPTKKEKPYESAKTGIIRNKKTGEIIKEYYPEVVEVVTEDDLIEIIKSFAWSPSVFNGVRLQDNFKSADFIALDIDSGLTIEEAERRCTEANLTALCAPSTSHKPDTPKFRLIFPLLKTITSKEVFDATLKELVKIFPEADPKCLECARFYFSSRMDDGFWLEFDLLEPVIPIKEEKRSFGSVDTSERVRVPMELKDVVKDLYGEEREYINEAVEHFLRNASTGLSGTWTCDLNNCCYVLSLQGIEEDVILDLMEYLAPRGELTKRDMDTIKRGIKDGQRKREE